MSWKSFSSRNKMLRNVLPMCRILFITSDRRYCDHVDCLLVGSFFRSLRALQFLENYKSDFYKIWHRCARTGGHVSTRTCPPYPGHGGRWDSHKFDEFGELGGGRGLGCVFQLQIAYLALGGPPCAHGTSKPWLRHCGVWHGCYILRQRLLNVLHCSIKRVADASIDKWCAFRLKACVYAKVDNFYTMSCSSV